MKYEQVKERVARGVYTQVLELRDQNAATYALMDAVAERRPHRASLQVFADKCYEIIMAWDVRCVGKLRELFPGYFPPSLKGPLEAGYDADGDWAVWSRQ